MPGQLFIVSAPSGAGKTTLVRLLIGNDPGVYVSTSTTTRAPRPGEQDGREYHFVDVQEFLEMVHRNEFVEWAEVHGNYYGTSQQWIQSEMNAGRDVLLEIDWQGARQVRKSFPEAVSMFVLPPSLESLGERLSGRATDSAETILRRVGAARDEMRHADEFDYVIINHQLPQALDDLQSIVNASRLKYTIQCQRHAALFAALL
jgi:guanylate kinase